MKVRVSIVSSEKLERFYEGGRKSVSYVCKCVIHDEGKVDVGTLRVPEALAPEGVVPGDYWIDFKAGRMFNDDAVNGRLCLLEAASAVSSRPSAVQKEVKVA